MNIGFVRIVIATALIACAIEKLFVFQTRRTTIMKKKLLILGALLAIGANVNFVEADGVLTYTTAVDFKSDGISDGVSNIINLDTPVYINKSGMTEINGGSIQLYSSQRSPGTSEQLTSLTGEALQFLGSGEHIGQFDINGMLVMEDGKDKGIHAVSGGIEIWGHPGDNLTQPKREMQFSIDNVDVGGQQIHGVLKGEADTDAVNVSQLKELRSQVDINTNDITDLKNKLGNTNILSEAKHYTDQRIAKAGAANAALSGLKYLDYDANHKVSAAASFGQYKGATAGAIGLAYQPNEDVLVHLGATVGSEHMLNGGVSIRVGDTTKGVKANTKNIAKEMDAIKAENAELKAELAEIKAMLTNK